MSLKSSKKLEEANKVELEVAVDGEVFKNAVNKVYKKQVKNINIPGFRKGKAPKQVVERMYGKEVFYDDAMQDCYPEALADASKEAEVKIVAVDTLEAIEASDDGFTFKAVIIVEPEVEVTDYKGIEVEKKSTEVTDELINEEIEKVRDRNSRMITVEDRAAENGDIAVIDFEGFVDGEAFEGGKAENYNLKLGDGQFIPGFEEQIVGHKTDEEFSINVTFPEDYQAEELKGKDAEFKIKLHEIKVKELPEVDDEFVKDVSEKETLEEYKKELSEQIKSRLENEADRDFDNQLIDKIIENTTGEIPEAMYNNQVNDMIREFDMRLRSQGMDMNTYLQYTGMNAESVSAMYKPEAEKRVKLRLALQAIAKNENLEADEKDIEEEYNRLAEAYKMDVEKVKEAISADGLAEDIKVDKAMKFVRDNAKTK
ncbi:MAG: trigger factor [Ruminococcus sp.]|nr:trigger factor [Ruminococcus sp.]